MREDKSVDQRRIYYDKSRGETLVASDSDSDSDSDEEAIDEDEENKEFADSEDYILRLV